MSVTSDHHSGRNPLATDGRGSPPAAVIPLALAENRRDERGSGCTGGPSAPVVVGCG